LRGCTSCVFGGNRARTEPKSPVDIRDFVLPASAYVVGALNGGFWARLLAAIQPAGAIGYPTRLGVDMEWTREVAAKHVSRDNLFHKALGMFAIRTRLDDQRIDILQRCRTARANRT
jgi:hypothetical protein